MAVIRDTPDEVVANRARGRMLSKTAARLEVRDLRPVISDEPPARGGENRGPAEESHERLDRLAGLVGRYCPVDSLIRAAVDDYEVSWERI